MAIDFTIERSGRTYNATADGGAAFFVGFQTSYTDKSTGVVFEGLYNVPTKEIPRLLYRADDARGAFGFWADFIEPTSRCEGGNFLTLNTYDRARFTWGFGQFAAHVPDGDFILFFRELLGRPEAAAYFPDLKIVGGRICTLVGAATVPLESAADTGPLMTYLNPTTTAVEDAEVIAAAKLIHWTTNHSEARALQTFHMIGAFKTLMAEADRRVGLDGAAADICCVVCDIRHQGRANFTAIQQAAGSAAPLTELLKLGSISYPDRLKTLSAALKAAAATFGAKHWSRAHADFV